MNLFILLLIASHSFFVVYAWSLRQELRETQADLDEFVDYIGDEFAEVKEREERQQSFCASCNKITNSSRAEYQDEFTCNDCGAEVQEEIKV